MQTFNAFSIFRHLRLVALLNIGLAFMVSASTGNAFELAQAQKKKSPTKHVTPLATPVADSAPTPSYSSRRWSSKMGPIDFSGMAGLYNPGFGIEALGAYRITNGFLKDLDDSLSVEAGLGYYGASQTFNGVSASFSIFQIPIMARWDLHLMDQKLIVGPRAGFAYLLGGSATVNGVSYTASVAGFNIEVGAFGMYKFSEQFAGRLGLTFGGFTTIQFGATYFL